MKRLLIIFALLLASTACSQEKEKYFILEDTLHRPLVKVKYDSKAINKAMDSLFVADPVKYRVVIVRLVYFANETRGDL